MTVESEKNTENREPKPRRRLFQKGQSGNPAGRPVGARKKITAAIEGRIADAAPELIEGLIADARKDARVALDLLKLLGLGRRTVIELPDALPIRTIDDIRAAHAIVIEKVLAGEICIEDGMALFGLLERHREAIEVAELAAEVKELKARVGLN